MNMCFVWNSCENKGNMQESIEDIICCCCLIEKYEIRKQIMEALEMLEPRVRIQNIYLSSVRNSMHISLHYGVVGSKEPQTLEVILQRVR